MTARHRRFVLLGLLVVAGMVGGGLVLRRAPGAEKPERAPLPAAAVVAVSALAGGEAPAPERLEIPPEGIEVCGVRRVPAEELRAWVDDPTRGKAQGKALLAQTQPLADAGVAKLAARLAAGSERQQVAARLLMRDIEGAATLAQHSSDGQAYQMALSACGGRGGDTPACARLNARRWAELDPTDARPWLRMARAAQQRKDAAGVDSALAQAAERTRLSRGGFLLEAQSVAVADAVPDAGELGHALVRVIGIDAAQPSWDVVGLLQVCKGDALQDATRLGHCRALARQVLATTTELLDAKVAQQLADRTGVPPEQQAYDAATLKAAQESSLERAPAFGGFDCAAMQRIRQFSTERATVGDLGMALAQLPARQPAR